MLQEEWVLKLTVKVTGETSVGDSYDSEKEIHYPLLATDAVDAQQRADIAIVTITHAVNTEDKEFFKKLHGDIDDEDGLLISNFRLCYEKKLSVPELCVMGGP